MRRISDLAPTDFAFVDISKYQANIDIAAYAAEHEAIILKVTEGAMYEDPFFAHFERETRSLRYRGFYHFLTHAGPAAQASNLRAVLNKYGLLPLRPGDFLILDWEKSSDTEPDRATGNVMYGLMEAISPDRDVWLYSYRSLLFRERQFGFTGPVWVASFDVIEDSYALGAVVDQYGVADSLPPYYFGQIDVNRVLDPAQFHALTYPQTQTEPEVELDTPLTIKEHAPDGTPTSDYPSNVGNTLSFTHDAAERAAGRARDARDNALQASVNALAASTKADLILEKIAALPAQDLQTVPNELLLAEVARRFRL